MDILLALVAFGVVLIPLIIIHEFGHLLACKSVGIAVLEFGLGFPPRVRKLFRWGETDFTLNALPIGGFVMPYGEDFIKQQNETEISSWREELIQRGVANPKSVFDATPWQKIWFLAAGPLANFLAAFVIFVIVPLTGLPVRQADVFISEVFPETEAASKALRKGDLIIKVNGQSFRNSERLEETLQEFVDAHPNTPVTFTIKRPAIISESTGEVLFQEQIFDTQLTPNLETEVPEERVRILEVQVGTPAEAAGLKAQDLVITANGEEIKTLEQLQQITADNYGKEITLGIERAGEMLEVKVTPDKLDGEDQPARIGIQINILIAAPAFGFVVDEQNIRAATERLGLIGSVDYGLDTFGEITTEIVRFPSRLLRGELTAQEARPVSPVAVSQIGGDIIQNRPYQDLLFFAALISIALGITNLLPIPALDGGRILFVIVEIIRGKPIPPEREAVVHLIGFALLMVLSVVLIVNDIVNPLQLPQ